MTKDATQNDRPPAPKLASATPAAPTSDVLMFDREGKWWLKLQNSVECGPFPTREVAQTVLTAYADTRAGTMTLEEFLNVFHELGWRSARVKR